MDKDRPHCTICSIAARLCSYIEQRIMQDLHKTNQQKINLSSDLLTIMEEIMALSVSKEQSFRR